MCTLPDSTPRRLPEEARGEFGASVKVEDHDDALSRFDIFEPFQVFFVDDQLPLHVGDAPMTGDLFGIRVHEADRFQFDAHTETPFICQRLIATTSR